MSPDALPVVPDEVPFPISVLGPQDVLVLLCLLVQRADHIISLRFAILELRLLPTAPPALPSSALCTARPVGSPSFAADLRKPCASCLRDVAMRVKRDDFAFFLRKLPWNEF